MIGFTAEAAANPFPPELEILANSSPSDSDGRADDSFASTSGSTEVDRGDGRMVRATVARGIVLGDLESLTGMRLPEPECDQKELEVGSFCAELIMQKQVSG